MISPDISINLKVVTLEHGTDMNSSIAYGSDGFYYDLTNGIFVIVLHDIVQVIYHCDLNSLTSAGGNVNPNISTMSGGLDEGTLLKVLAVALDPKQAKDLA